MTHDHDHADAHAPIEVDVSDGPDYFEVMVHALQELLFEHLGAHILNTDMICQ